MIEDNATINFTMSELKAIKSSLNLYIKKEAVSNNHLGITSKRLKRMQPFIDSREKIKHRLKPKT